MLQNQTSKNSVGRFWLLFAIWGVFALVIPVSYYVYTNVRAVQIVTQHLSYGTPNEIMSTIVFISLALGNAALIYIAARYSFRRSLLLAAAWTVVEVPYTIASLIVEFSLNHVQFTFMIWLNAFFQTLIDFAVVVAIIALVRLFASRVKKEWAVLLCALAVLFLLHVISADIGTVIAYIIFQNPFAFSSLPVPVLLPSLIKLAITAVGYGLLTLIFMEHKKDNFRTFFANSKMFTKKVWEATAK